MKRVFCFLAVSVSAAYAGEQLSPSPTADKSRYTIFSPTPLALRRARTI